MSRDSIYTLLYLAGLWKAIDSQIGSGGKLI